MIGGKWYKMLWGAQFGFGVRTGPLSPNQSMPNVPSSDPGCPTGCLFDIVAVRSLRAEACRTTRLHQLCRLLTCILPMPRVQDPTETTDLHAQQPQIFAQLLERQSEIGLTVYQTNYSDFDDDAGCLTPVDMVTKYSGFLGPRCGVSPP